MKYTEYALKLFYWLNRDYCTYLRDLEKEREGLWFLSLDSDLSLLLSLERDL